MEQLSLHVALLLAVIIMLFPCCSGKVITVSTFGTNNETVCRTGQEKCSNLTMALAGAHNTNNTIIVMEPGSYSLAYTSSSLFQHVNNIAITGLVAGEVNVSCEEGAGLTFLQSMNIEIANISFYGCGCEQVSTSRTSTMNGNDTDSEFAKYNVALFFQLCVNVTLSRVGVLYSKNIGVQFFATVGNNVIEYSLFAYNTGGSGESNNTFGGGLYIEFPYCLPGPDRDNCSSVPPQYTSEGKFHIAHTNFSYNKAIPNQRRSRVFMVPHLSNHEAFGRGGGLSVFLKNHTNLVVINVSQCIFDHNEAIFGGGAFADFQDNCHNNTILFNKCSFHNNQASQQGGGLRTNLIFITKQTNVSNNLVELTGLCFSHNSAEASGGGMFVGATRENASHPTNRLNVFNSEWIKNVAPIGSAITMAVWHQIAIGAIIVPQLYNCTFIANGIDRKEGLVGKGTLYLDSIPLHFWDTVRFQDNLRSAVAGANTGIYFAHDSQAYFINNSAHNGAAIALLGNAFFVVHGGTSLTFVNNTANYLGGAIYATSLTGQDSISSGNCFLRYHDILRNPSQWNTMFSFQGNTAMGRSNSIYASSLEPCLWGKAYGPPENNEKLISNVFCWNDNGTKWYYGTGNTNCSEEIMSGPSQYLPSHTVNLTVMPGIWKNFDLTTLDDLNNNVSQYTVFVAQSATEGIHLGDHSHYLAHNAIQIFQTNHSVTAGTVQLATVNTPNSIEGELKITFLKCPPGFVLSEKGECVCAYKHTDIVRCHVHSTTAYSKIQRGYWVGLLPFDNKSEVVAHCPLCFGNSSNATTVESYEDVQNQLCLPINRTGPLCSKCIPNYCPAVNSENYHCIEYSPGIPFALRIFFFFLSKLLFSFIMLWIIYRIGMTVSSGKYNAPIFFAQMVTTVIAVDADGIIPYPYGLRKAYFMLYDVWNLELRLPNGALYCLHSDMSVTFVIALNYFVALLPLLGVIAMAIAYKCYDNKNRWLCRCASGQCCERCCGQGCGNGGPFKFIKWILISNERKHLVSAVAAFFVLSYMKLATTTIYLLTPSILTDVDGMILYWDGSKRYPQDVVQYLIIAGVCCVYLLVVPLSLLILRYSDPRNSDGFLQYLLAGLQADLRSGSPDNAARPCFPCCNEIKMEGNTRIANCCMCRKVTINSTKEEICSVDAQCARCNIFCSCGPHDFRWVSGAYFALRLLMLLPFVVSRNALIHLIAQLLISCAAAAFFVIFKPYGFNHMQRDPAAIQRRDQVLDQNSEDHNIQRSEQSVEQSQQEQSRSTEVKIKPSFYNQLDASVFILLSGVIGLSIYRYQYSSTTDSDDFDPVLVVQSVLLFLPAAWFAFWAVVGIITGIYDLIRQPQRYGQLEQSARDE